MATKPIGRSSYWLMAAAAILITMLAVVLTQQPASAAPDMQSPQNTSRIDLIQFDCPDTGDMYTQLCMKWNAGSILPQWPSATLVKVYSYSEAGALRPSGTPFENPSGWSTSLVKTQIHQINNATNTAFVVSGLNPGTKYMVTVEGKNPRSTEGKGPATLMRTLNYPKPRNLRVSHDCEYTDTQMCIAWDMERHNGAGPFLIDVFGSANRADADAKILSYNHQVDHIQNDDPHARMQKITGLQPGHWYTFVVTDKHDNTWIRTPAAVKTLTAPPASSFPAPRCVSRFDAARHWMSMLEPDGTKGLLSACVWSMTPSGFTWAETRYEIQSADQQETYTSQYLNGSGMYIIPTPNIRDGQKYRIRISAGYIRNGTNETYFSLPHTEWITYNAAAQPSYSCNPDCGPVTISMSADKQTIGEYLGRTRITVELNRELSGSESVTAALNVSHTTQGRQPWRLVLNNSENHPGVKRTATGPNSQIEFTAGARKAYLWLSAQPYHDADHTIDITFGNHTTSGISNLSTGDNGHIQVKVREMDRSVPLIRMIPGPDVTEGETAKFNFLALPAPAQPLQVHYRIEYDNYIIDPSWNGPHTVTIGTNGVGSVEIPTRDNSDDEPDKHITLTVQPSGSYVVDKRLSIKNQPYNRAMLKVSDNDDLRVTVSAVKDQIFEGQDARFSIKAVPMPGWPTEINYKVTMNGNIRVSGSKEITGTLKMPADGGHQREVTVSTHDDQVKEDDGSMTITLLPGEGYNVKDPSTATVTVIDDETLPEVTVTADRHTVYEGENATFSFSTSRPHRAPLGVGYNILVAGNVSNHQSGTVAVQSETTAKLQIPTLSNFVKGAGGKITLTVVDGNGYVGHARQASVRVQDHEPTQTPTVSVSPADTPAEKQEGQSLTFNLSAGRELPSAKTVNVTVKIIPDDYDSTSNTQNTTVQLGTDGTGVLEVHTTDDAKYQRDGKATVTVAAGDWYNPNTSGGAHVARYTVKNNDAPPPLNQCAPNDLKEKVRSYYDENKQKAPNYGANWFRVLIAFGVEQPDSRSAYTADEALASEQHWGGWKPIRVALECLEAPRQ